MKCKKLLTSLLAIALVVTSLYPTSFVKAATTTKQNDGLNFQTTTATDNDYYYSDEKLTQFPATFEATVRISTAGDMVRAGTILGNAIINETNTSTDQTGNFNFGFINGMHPYIWVADASNKYGTIYKFKPNNTVAQNSEVFRTGEWIHLSIVNDVAADKLYCYVDGELFDTIDGAYKGTWSMSANQLRLGGDNRKGNSQNFKGDIRNVAIFKDARTAAEVKSDYQNGVKGNEDKLMAAYNLALTSEGNYPSQLKDLSPNKYNLKKDWFVEKEANKYSGKQDYDYAMAIIGDPQIVTAHAQMVTNNSANASATRTADSDDKIFQWVADNAESKKIKFAFNLGDLNDNNTQWESGLAALQILDDKVPYSIVRGNHDHVTEFVQNIKYEDYADRIEGSFDGSTMLNTYQKFQVGNHKYMVINFDFGVGGDDANDADAVLAWANEVVAANPDYKVIVTTHAYQASDGTRLAPGKSGFATNEKSGYYRQKDGEDIWNEFASLHENIIMVLSGHVGSKTIVKTESIGVHGNKVVELMVNPQEMDKKLYDNGYMMGGMVAMLYFSNDGNDVSVEWYSTLRDQYYTVESQFSFDMSTVELEDGQVALRYDSVDMSGSVPVAKPAEYKDYIFAGWYSDASCAANKALGNVSVVTKDSYAKFIPEDILSIKAQVSTAKMTEGTYAGNWVMRFVSSVESLNYKSVGFKVSYEEGGQVKTKTSSSQTVYERIKSTEASTDYGFSTGVIDEHSKYFITGKLPVADTATAKATTYTVQAYVETIDGTISYGPARILSFNDSNGETLNVTVKADKQLSTTGTYAATYGVSGTENTATKVEVLSSDADGTSNIRITVSGGVASLQSATRYIITDATGRVATDIYRNYYTTHESGNVKAPNADTSWYDVDPYADEYVVASSADLYGLAYLAEGKVNFTGKTILLVRDVVVNEGKAIKATTSTAAKWQEDDGVVYPWRPIGRNAATGNLFDGTFDGQGNSVSGLYQNNTSSSEAYWCSDGYAGFFGMVSEKGAVRNLSIKNSYFANSKNYTGGVIGFCRSQRLENLYSDAVVVSSGSHNVGGMVGRYGDAADSSDKTALRWVSGCQFDGQIYLTGGVQYIGGMFGQAFRANNFKLTDCLFSGEILYKGTQASPYIGGMFAGTGSIHIVMENCVSTGTITNAGSATDSIGMLVAVLNGTTISKVENCYATNGGPFNRTFGSVSGTALTPAVDAYIVSVDSLKVTTEAALLQKLPLLAGQTESAWTCVTNGTPVLKYFAE